MAGQLSTPLSWSFHGFFQFARPLKFAQHPFKEISYNFNFKFHFVGCIVSSLREESCYIYFLLFLLSSQIVAHSHTGATIQCKCQSNSSSGIVRIETIRLNWIGNGSICSPKFWETLIYHKKLVIKAFWLQKPRSAVKQDKGLKDGTGRQQLRVVFISVKITCTVLTFLTLNRKLPRSPPTHDCLMRSAQGMLECWL